MIKCPRLKRTRMRKEKHGNVGDDELIKIHYHTNEPWQVLEYCASLGEIYDIVVENMERQEQGLQG